MALKKILIADDEPDVLAILEKKLKQSGFDVLALSNGKDVVVNVKKFQPDLLILDIIMPGMDGYSATVALREAEQTKKTPVIFMTGKELDYSGIQKRVEKLGCCDIITKPCTFDELLAKVNVVLK